MLLERINASELKKDNYKNNPFFYSEMKLDGIRLLLTKFNGRIRLYTRHGNECSDQFPELKNISSIPDGTILDGEIIVTRNGSPCFESMMERFLSMKNENPVQYGVFDILYSNNVDIMNLPLSQRKLILKNTIPIGNSTIFAVPYLEGRAYEYFTQIVQYDLEGIVIKKSDSLYRKNKRSDAWLKVINYKYEPVFITKIKKDKFGAVLTFEDGRYAGIMEFVPPAERAALYNNIDKSKDAKNENFYTLKSPIRCIVKYRNLTSQGLLRIPSFCSWSEHIAS